MVTVGDHGGHARAVSHILGPHTDRRITYKEHVYILELDIHVVPAVHGTKIDRKDEQQDQGPAQAVRDPHTDIHFFPYDHEAEHRSDRSQHGKHDDHRDQRFRYHIIITNPITNRKARLIKRMIMKTTGLSTTFVTVISCTSKASCASISSTISETDRDLLS